MGDILDRLRHITIVAKPAADNWNYECGATIRDAEDAITEIERLRADLARVTAERDEAVVRNIKYAAEASLLCDAVKSLLRAVEAANNEINKGLDGTGAVMDAIKAAREGK